MKSYHLHIALLALLLCCSPVLSWVEHDSVATLSAATPKKKTASAKAGSKSKAKNKANKVTKPKATSRATQSAPKQEVAFAQRVQEVERHNAKVAAYTTRDISHRIGIWGQVGYSAILPFDFQYDVDAQMGVSPSVVGGVGGGIGLGYQLRYHRFLFTTGAEFQMYNSQTHIAPFNRTFNIQPYESMQYTYSYTDLRDYWQAGYLQIPLLFGMELADWYWQAGAKLGIGVMGNATLKGSLSTTIHDNELIDDLQDMYNHALVNDIAIAHTQPVRFGFNTALAAEVGLSLDRWTRPTIKRKQKPTPAQLFAQGLHYRIALFAEYGLLNIQSPSNIRPNTPDVADFSTVMGRTPSQPSDLYNNVAYISALSTSSAANARLNPLLVGVKLSVSYELPRQTKKMLPMPTEPLPRMAIEVTNVETGKPLAGVQLNIMKPSGKRTNKTSNGRGVAIARLSKGTYQVSASKLGFLPSDTITLRHTNDLRDTIRFALYPEPKPIVHTLCGYVMDEATHLPLEADIRIVSVADTTRIYTGSTNEDGLFATGLLAGKYRFSALCAGYMPLTDEVLFEQDTLHLYMSAIKEGIKVKINHLYFATNKTVILPTSEEALNDLAIFLRDNPSVAIRIIGHTDNVGTEEFNMRLSIGRAKAVRNNLIQRGIDANRIEYDGKGETSPIATNDTEEGRAQNRRVEFEIISTNED